MSININVLNTGVVSNTSQMEALPGSEEQSMDMNAILADESTSNVGISDEEISDEEK